MLNSVNRLAPNKQCNIDAVYPDNSISNIQRISNGIYADVAKEEFCWNTKRALNLAYCPTTFDLYKTSEFRSIQLFLQGE